MVRALAGSALCCFGIACGASSGGSAGGTPDGGGTAANGGDASPALGNGECVALVAGGPAVGTTYTADAPPLPAGGTVADGIYALTECKVYGTPAGSVDMRKETLRFAAGYEEYADGSGQVIGRSYASASATELEFSEICHVPSNQFSPVKFRRSYTATATTYAEFSDSHTATSATVCTHTRQLGLTASP